MPLGESVWSDASVLIPEEIPGKTFRNVFTGETLERFEKEGEGALPLSDVFSNFPVALLEKI